MFNKLLFPSKIVFFLKILTLISYLTFHLFILFFYFIECEFISVHYMVYDLVGKCCCYLILIILCLNFVSISVNILICIKSLFNVIRKYRVNNKIKLKEKNNEINKIKMKEKDNEINKIVNPKIE